MPGVLEGPSTGFGARYGSYYQSAGRSSDTSVSSALRYRENLYRPSLTEIAEIETVLWNLRSKITQHCLLLQIINIWNTTSFSVEQFIVYLHAFIVRLHYDQIIQ